jgi:hypothetical protein
MKDEGGRMKEKQSAMAARMILGLNLKTFILHPSSFILQQSGGLR